MATEDSTEEIPDFWHDMICMAVTEELHSYFSDSRGGWSALAEYEVQSIVGGILQRARSLYLHHQKT